MMMDTTAESGFLVQIKNIKLIGNGHMECCKTPQAPAFWLRLAVERRKREEFGEGGILATPR
jgi:hypothetical protein